VNKKGDWTVDRWAGTGSYDIDVVMTNAADERTGGPVNILLNQNVDLPFALTSPENGADLRGQLVTFEGDGNANEEVTITVTNFESTPISTRVDTKGHWKLEKFLGTGAYTIDITQKNRTTGAITGELKGLQFNQPAN
jgi:hypothetical protein